MVNGVKRKKLELQRKREKQKRKELRKKDKRRKQPKKQLKSHNKRKIKRSKIKKMELKAQSQVPNNQQVKKVLKIKSLALHLGKAEARKMPEKVRV